MTNKTPLKTFTASNGVKYHGQELIDACGVVADFYVKNAWDIWHEDSYASHVTQETKDANLNGQLAFAARVRRGDPKECNGFSVAQRLNMELCGECPALLP